MLCHARGPKLKLRRKNKNPPKEQIETDSSIRFVFLKPMKSLTENLKWVHRIISEKISKVFFRDAECKKIYSTLKSCINWILISKSNFLLSNKTCYTCIKVINIVWNFSVVKYQSYDAFLRWCILIYVPLDTVCSFYAQKFLPFVTTVKMRIPVFSRNKIDF